MRDKESMREAGTCLGGFLGMFFGGMLAFAVFTKIAFDKLAREDGTIHPDMAVQPFLWVVAGGTVGAVAGALLASWLLTAFGTLFRRPPGKTGDGPKDNRDAPA